MNEDWVIMEVTGLTMDPFTNMPILILKDAAAKIALPIWIGLIEAASIATELEGMHPDRPLTHDLMQSMFTQMDIQLKAVEIHGLVDHTFYAQLKLKQGRRHYHFDARPSDAIALALRFKSPILVARSVIDKSRRIDLSQTQGPIDEKKWAELLENLKPEDFGKYKM